MEEETQCTCGAKMRFLMDNKKEALWECPSCARLQLRPKTGDRVSFYICMTPEGRKPERR